MCTHVYIHQIRAVWGVKGKAGMVRLSQFSNILLGRKFSTSIYMGILSYTVIYQHITYFDPMQRHRGYFRNNWVSPCIYNSRKGCSFCYMTITCNTNLDSKHRETGCEKLHTRQEIKKYVCFITFKNVSNSP